MCKTFIDSASNTLRWERFNFYTLAETERHDASRYGHYANSLWSKLRYDPYSAATCTRLSLTLCYTQFNSISLYE